MQLQFSHHAYHRLAQRNLSEEDVQFIINYGASVHANGVIYRQMRDNCFPRNIPGNSPLRRLRGTTIILCSCGRYVITAYRNPRAFQHDRRKTKYSLQDLNDHCPYCSCTVD